MSVEAIHNRLDDLTPGGLVGPYLLLTPLGVGGSGWVWAAARLGARGAKRTALKIMRPDTLRSPSSQLRFAREAQLGAELRHANIRTVYELNEQDGLPYMAMRWAETSLSELLLHAPDQRLEPELTCWFGLQCCRALAAIHGHSSPEHTTRDGRLFSNALARGARAAPTVHRDVSPDNVLLTVDGQVLLCDLAASNDTANPHAPLADGPFFGKPAYASPEALRELPVDGRSDLFSLGCTLYQALAGQRPFDAEDEHSVVYQILEQDPPELAQLCPDAPLALIAIVERALAKDADRRFQTAEDMAHELAKCVASVSDLEQRAAATIRAVLGDRLRDREQAMQAVFRRWAPSLEERPDLARTGIGQKPVEEPGIFTSERSVSTPGAASPRSAAPPTTPLQAFRTVAATFAMLMVGAGLGWGMTRSSPAFPPAGAALANVTAEPSGAAMPLGPDGRSERTRPESPASGAPSDAPTPVPPSVAVSTPSPSAAVSTTLPSAAVAPTSAAAAMARRTVTAARPKPVPGNPVRRVANDLQRLTAEAHPTERAAQNAAANAGPASGGSPSQAVPVVSIARDDPHGSGTKPQANPD